MKKLLKFIFLITSAISFFNANPMIIGTLETQREVDNYTEITPIFYATESQTYTTGGLTFNYPAGTFTAPPIVQVSVNPTTPHPNSETFGPEISTNSPTSTTIMVYFINSSGVSEAANGTVTVNILATGY